jgi:membrane fusion protein (multidrug efflux system)
MRHNRRLIRVLFLGIVPLLIVLALAEYYVSHSRYVTTENAYVKAHLVSVAAEVSGRVAEVHVRENAQIQAGGLLFTIDPVPFRIDLEKAAAELVRVQNDIRALRAEHRQVEMELKEAQANIAYMERAFARQRALVDKGVASQARFEEAENGLAISRERAGALREKAQRLLAKLGGSTDVTPERHPDYLEAKAKRDRAELDLRRTAVVAPTDGIVGRLRLQPGEYVRAGDSVLPLVQTSERWIEANLKETQLTHVRVGQKVEIVVDAYPDRVFQATVKSISPSTGAELAILPPQNASGNWVKVVQRVPVRIELAEAAAPELRAGMTVAVSVDTERSYSLIDFVGSAVARIVER